MKVCDVFHISVSSVDDARGLGLKRFIYIAILLPNLNNPTYVPFDRSEQIRHVYERQHKNTFLAEQVETEALTNMGQEDKEFRTGRHCYRYM